MYGSDDSADDVAAAFKVRQRNILAARVGDAHAAGAEDYRLGAGRSELRRP